MRSLRPITNVSKLKENSVALKNFKLFSSDRKSFLKSLTFYTKAQVSACHSFTWPL